VNQTGVNFKKGVLEPEPVLSRYMRIIVLGSDGYLGFPLVLKLLGRGHEVVGVDNLSRRRMVREVDGWSAVPLVDPFERVMAVREEFPEFVFRFMDLTNTEEVNHLFYKHKPDAVVHLGENPSAPYSMIDSEHAVSTYMNNVGGTLNVLHAMRDFSPDCHMIKLGTMGEYGTPNIDIPEGKFEIEYRGRKDVLPFPKQPGSFYHASKVADTINIQFASKIWGLRATDIHQGVVYGIITEDMEHVHDRNQKDVDDRLVTRFDFDETFGTALNRFTAQAVIGHKLTPYGRGGQTRGYIALRDSMQCLTIALENPAEGGEYRTFNQLDETYSVMELAKKVVKVGRSLSLDVEIWDHVENPRVEAEEHYYNPDRENLRKLGFKPTMSIENEIDVTLKRLMRYKERIEEKRSSIMPRTKWDPRK